MRNVIYLFLESPKRQNGQQVYNILYVGQTDSASFSSTVSTRDSPPAALLYSTRASTVYSGLATTMLLNSTREFTRYTARRLRLEDKRVFHFVVLRGGGRHSG